MTLFVPKDDTVSIRARFLGRAMPDPVGIPTICYGFNPRPVFRPGDANFLRRTLACLGSFNPRPVFRPGDAPEIPHEQPTYPVSIRARFLGRAMPKTSNSAVPTNLFQSAPGF